MSGFGKAVSILNGFSLEVEVKSVNNRFLEVSLKLPSSLQNKEFELKELIKNKIKRGKLYVNLNLKSVTENESIINLNEEKLHESLKILKKIRKAIGSKEKIKLEHVLSFRDLFSPELGEFSEENFNHLKDTVAKALDELVKMRKNEGEVLQIDLAMRINSIESFIEKIESIHRKEVENYFSKVKERAKQIVENISDYSDRLEVELAILIEKSDITEEYVRLRSHIKHFKETLKDENEIGRKLNFLCQEMHREGNTIASKSLSAEITYQSILIREEIEKIREQIQNIE
jgi:uncharacterized protein (TIGR00255 family)